MIYRKINFITVSESSKQEMIEAGIPSQNIKIIHNGIANNYKPNWNLKSHYPHILF